MSRNSCSKCGSTVNLDPVLKKESVITLDRTVYPLVVGCTDKITFENWETSGSTVQLHATVNHPVYTESDVTWTSENPDIAVVHDDGLVQGRTTGFTKILASLPSGDMAVCYISVIDNITRSTVMSLELNTDSLTLGKGGSAVLIPIIYPEDVLGNGAMNREVIWSSSDASVAVVDEYGKISAVGTGSAEIKAKSKDVGRTAVCKVTVIDEPVSVTGISKIKIDEKGAEKIRITTGEQKQLFAKVKGGESELSWKSMNSYIADVDENGKVTAYSNGEVDILVTTKLGGYVERYTFVVNEAPVLVESVNINKRKVNLSCGSSKNITATVSPAIILDKKITWSSSDESVVKVIETEDTVYGAAQVILSAVGEGTAVVTAASGGKQDTCLVTVTKSVVPVTKITLNSDLEIDIDQVCRINVSVNSDATDAELVYLSTDRNIATVNQEGIVKGYKAGNAIIYIIAKDSLTKEQEALIEELKTIRKITDESGEVQNKLNTLLNSANVTWNQCRLKVKDSSPYLHNLHAPSEAITYSSVNLLWNRASLLYTGNWKAYRIYCNDKLVAVTEKLGHTVKNLNPDTSYTFTVKAIDINENELVSESITVRTKSRPTKIIDVTKEPYRALGNGKVMDTYAIQKAINDCPEGGVVLLPEGHVFYSGALFLKSNMTFQVDGILIGSTDPKDYPLIITRWEGWRKLAQPAEKWANSTGGQDNRYAHASLINAGVYDEGDIGKTGPFNVSNLVICGKGQINGNGFKLGYNEGPNQKSGNGGKPVPESTKLDPTVRGRAITLHNAQNVYIADLNVAYSPSWTIHPIFCDNVTFDNIDLVSKGTGKTGAADDITILNGDGIDPDSSTNINIFNCRFFAGDDAIALKSGRNREGNELAKPVAYIRVTDCISEGSKGGFCIGSEQAAGAHDILWQNLTVDNINLFGLWIKANVARGGLMSDILWKDCRISRTSGVIFMNLDYHSSQTNAAATPPEICNMTFENIRGIGTNALGIRFDGLENSSIHDIVIRGCSFDAISRETRAFAINYGYNFDISDVQLPEGFTWEISNASNINI